MFNSLGTGEENLDVGCEPRLGMGGLNSLRNEQMDLGLVQTWKTLTLLVWLEGYSSHHTISHWYTSAYTGTVDPCMGRGSKLYWYKAFFIPVQPSQ